MKKTIKNRVSLYSLLLIFVFAFAIPAFAVESKVKFEWVYADKLSSVINGFRIYATPRANSDETGPVMIAELRQGSLRTHTMVLDLPVGVTHFFVAPFIGDTQGEPSIISSIEVLENIGTVDNFRATLIK